jgi:hypothetical protein
MENLPPSLRKRLGGPAQKEISSASNGSDATGSLGRLFEEVRRSTWLCAGRRP